MRDMIQSSTIPAKSVAKTTARLFDVAARLRVSEKLALIYLTYVSIAAPFYRVWVTQGFTIAVLNFLATGVITLLGKYSADSGNRQRGGLLQGRAEPGPETQGASGVASHSVFLATIRNWFPAVLILLAYRESGLLFFPDSTHRLDYLFVRWDHTLLENRWVLGVLDAGAPWLQRYLEFAYSLCYPLVPLGLGALYVLGQWPKLAAGGRFDADRAIDRFWTTVLLAQFTCYALFPLFPSTPPRVFFHDLPGPVVQPLFRQMNFWILGQYGIQSSVFPSGHVAAVTATALSVRAYWPRAGVLFGIAAASVAVATVIGRYHYAADAVAGALIGITAFLASSRIHKPCGQLVAPAEVFEG